MITDEQVEAAAKAIVAAAFDSDEAPDWRDYEPHARAALAAAQAGAPVDQRACPHWPGCGCGTQSGPHTCEWRPEPAGPSEEDVARAIDECPIGVHSRDGEFSLTFIDEARDKIKAAVLALLQRGEK